MLQQIAWISLAIAFLCALLIAIDLTRHPQKMAIMNLVWPITALYGSVFALWAYLRIGRNKPKPSKPQHNHQQHPRPRPAIAQIALAASHCGAGCTLGDIAADFLIFTLTLHLFHSNLLTAFLIDYLFAWAFGVVFQYFTIAPMQGLAFLPGIWAAIKADTLSITAWQIGMYAFMALTYFVFFPSPHLHPNQPQYWLLMQPAMIAGFITAYPMNYLLVKTGRKEAMS